MVRSCPIEGLLPRGWVVLTVMQYVLAGQISAHHPDFEPVCGGHCVGCGSIVRFLNATRTKMMVVILKIMSKCKNIIYE